MTLSATEQTEQKYGKRMYAVRPCPQCGHILFGMSGSWDAVCLICGYKDPCCSD